MGWDRGEMTYKFTLSGILTQKQTFTSRGDRRDGLLLFLFFRHFGGYDPSQVETARKVLDRAGKEEQKARKVSINSNREGGGGGLPTI